VLNLYHAADLETLGELACTLLAQPMTDALAAQPIVVPSQGIGRWLELAVARHQGIAMRLEFELPSAFVWRLSRQVLGELPEQSAFAPENLTWRLYDWLSKPSNLLQIQPLARYLKDGDERRRLTLSARIADVFDQYLLYRNDWLAAWERGQLLALGADEAWQARLWRELTKSGHPHRARLLDALLRRLYSDDPLPDLPERLLVFGISSLPPHQLQVLAGLSRHCEVALCALSPCREFWGDLRDKKQLLQDNRVSPDDWYLDLGNPLLASLGKQGRDFFQSLLQTLDSEQGEAFAIYPEDDELKDDSLLHALQNDVLRLHARTPEQRLPLVENDRSLEIHSAHSPLREVEILYDQLLARFAEDRTLTPDQVVVLTPNIEQYAPWIEAVFGHSTIPFNLEGRSPRAENPLAEPLLTLLALPDSRFNAEDILGLLECPPIAERAAISDADLPLLRDWLQEAGVRWGRDSEHRKSLGLPPNAAIGWQEGLDRLLLGFAAPPALAGENPPLLGEQAPLDVLEGSRAQLLGQLAAFVSLLSKLAQSLLRPRPLADWADSLQQILDTLFDENSAGEDLLLLHEACARLREQAAASGITRPLERALIQQQLTDLLSESRANRALLNGALTFASMVPLRSLPFRLICLLGLDDHALPRRTTPVGFDLIAQHPRSGDRMRRLDDRYLFLEALLCARKALYISYVGRSVRDNSELPPSVLVSELLEVVDNTTFSHNGKASALIHFYHPLQAFAASNFQGGRGQSFAAPWFRAASALAQPARAEPAPFTAPLPASEGETVEVDLGDFLHCFANPSQFFLQRRLGLYLPDSDTNLEVDEPFELARKPSQQLAALALAGFEKKWNPAIMQSLARALLPAGELGKVHWQQLQDRIGTFAPRLCEQRPQDPIEPLPIAFKAAGVQLYGHLADVRASGLFDFRLDKLAPWDLPAFWLRHLLLCLCAPPEIIRNSLLLSPQQSWHLGVIERPAEQLTPWLAAYRQALSQPLPFFSRASLAFAEKAQNLPPEAPRSEAHKAAHTIWAGNGFIKQKPERENPWHALAFRGREALNTHFAQLAETLLVPALQARVLVP